MSVLWGAPVGNDGDTLLAVSGASLLNYRLLHRT
jgi:hypothetical protein